MRDPSNPASMMRRLCSQAALLALALAASAVPATAADIGSERAIKAAFVSRFIVYVEFSGRPQAPAPLVIGVVGADDIAGELARIVPRGINGRAVSVRTMRADDRLDAVDVLFLGLDESERAARLLRTAAAAGILTITEFDHALRQGSVINFRIVDERVRFEVSLAAAEKANLKLSSLLLSVAYYVDKGVR